MKLRYLHLAHYPPLNDVTVRFSSGSPLERECAIRFVVGVNGSGKSHLLRAVAETFVALADQRPPHFPVSLIYELGQDSRKRTLVLDCPGTRAESSLWMAERFVWPNDVRDEDFENSLEYLRANTGPPPHGFYALIAPGTWPTSVSTPPAIALPRAVLAYTTGELAPWNVLWQRESNTEGVNLVSQGLDYDADRERPPGWSADQEANTRYDKQVSSAANVDNSRTAAEESARGWRPILVHPTLLRCALLAVALPNALPDSHGYLAPESHDGAGAVHALLERGAWKQIVSISVRINFRPELWSDEKLRRALPWLLAAGEVIAEPSPSTMRTLHFDLHGAYSSRALEQWTNDQNVLTAHTQGEALVGLLGGLEVSAFDRFERLKELYEYGLIEDLRFAVARTDTPDILRFEEFSDGEQMVLGRMAIFHLLVKEDDALLLLDEPETHFNDKWKREIVDIIDNAIGQTANDVLIATHSAIVITDVFNDEIVLMEKQDGNAIARTVADNTFAADPGAVMMRVFNADDSIGQRAREFIERKLQQATGSAADIEQLEALIAQMGSGFYRSELRTLLNKWRGGNA
jgi:predicted ATPase